MPVLVNFGGGGATYLIDIKAYSSEIVIPTAGILGRIAVVTDHPIPSWSSGGIMIKASRPLFRNDGSGLQVGDLCIIDDVISNTSFDVVKGVTVYPVACFQYSGTAWVERVAKFDNGTTWVDLYLYLYYSGDKCVNVSGGWEGRAWQYIAGSGVHATLPAITDYSDHVKIEFGSSKTYYSAVYQVINDIDLTSFATIEFDGYKESAGGVFLAVAPRTAEYCQTNATALVQISALVRTKTSLNVEGCNGAFCVYVCVYTGATSGNATAHMFAVRLKK